MSLLTENQNENKNRTKGIILQNIFHYINIFAKVNDFCWAQVGIGRHRQLEVANLFVLV